MILREQNEKLVYSDGCEAEGRMLELAKQYPGEAVREAISENYDYTTNNTFSAVRENILSWYPFDETASVLEVGAGMGALTSMLCRRCGHVTAVELSENRAEVLRERCREQENLEIIVGDIQKLELGRKFDYAVLVGVLEYAAVFSDSGDPFYAFLSTVRGFLKETGRLFLAIENQYGLKYWLGASEDHLQQPFKGIAGYRQSGTARTFSKAELENLLSRAGFSQQRFYYAFPDYKFPTMLFTDDWIPDGSEFQNIAFTYGKNSVLTANEKDLYGDLAQNGVLPFFANSFLVEAGAQDLEKEYPVFIAGRSEVRPEYRIATTIDTRGNLRKTAVHPAAQAHLDHIEENEAYLARCGIRVLQSRRQGKELIRPILEAVRADHVFAELIKRNDLDAVLAFAAALRDDLLKSSKTAAHGRNYFSEHQLCQSDMDLGTVLERGFVDMTFYNAFFDDDELIFFDQEWCFPDIPLDFILYYAVKSVFARNDAEGPITPEMIFECLQIGKEKQDVFDRAEAFIWSRILYRQGDLYGKGGYCTQYHDTERFDNVLSRMPELTRELQDKTQELQSKTQELRNKQGHIERLLVSDRELARIRSSRSWRFMGYAWKARDTVAPHGSKRRLLLKMAVKFVKHPIRFLRKASPARVLKFFRTLKREGAAGVSRRLDDCLIGAQLQQQALKIVPVTLGEAKAIVDYAAITVPQWETPLVSIVIPAYNQFGYTYQCICSIVENSGAVSYEIILADDCSTDLTREIGQVINGLVIERNAENLRFLKNCNRAAKRAKGRYILFLNNDTQVQEDWLAPLVALMESDPKIGMVGSKLVYPDGRLQEAGGILWQDGSAWNYGNRSDPAAPEFNYVKEADYISGASIMIRRSLWEEIGGFDERFAPAYCEDSDLAFTVREKGYRVMYQPLSVVVHFEGVSNGTDTSSGQKAYQIANQQKFYEKWKETLEQGYFPREENVFLAREHGRGKKVLLMVDHYVPQYDKDAGSRTVFQYLQMFAARGYHIKFIGDNFYPHQPYTQVLQQMGIEVLYGPYYAKYWQEWIQENGASIHYAFLNRPHISVKYIDKIRQKTSAKIIYYGHDLHFLREQREYELTKDAALLKSSGEWKKKELELMRKADVVYYPSCVEAEEIYRISPEIRVKAIPAYLFSEIKEIPFHAEERHDLMFIGGFSHRPNVDAVKWLAQEIMPELKKLLPEVRVHILGSNPPDEITALADEQLLIEGFVTDEQLETFYQTCRMALVPLRYGAGIKGKVIEAMRYGLPVVTTSVGAEGIPGTEGILCVADTSKEFAQKAAAAYKDLAALADMSHGSVAYIREHFSPENAAAVIGEDFDMEEQLT